MMMFYNYTYVKYYIFYTTVIKIHEEMTHLQRQQTHSTTLGKAYSTVLFSEIYVIYLYLR